MELEHPDFERKPRAATIGMLAERFPDTFTTELAKVRPLAIGIFHTLQLWCPDIPPMQLRSALHEYCQHGAYQRSLVAGAPRIDLDGAPSGAVTADAALHAARLLAAREAAAARQAAEAKAVFAAKPRNPAHRPIEGNRIIPSGPALRAAGSTPTAGQRRLGLADLRAAALARRTGAADGGAP